MEVESSLNFAVLNSKSGACKTTKENSQKGKQLNHMDAERRRRKGFSSINEEASDPTPRLPPHHPRSQAAMIDLPTLASREEGMTPPHKEASSCASGWTGRYRCCSFLMGNCAGVQGNAEINPSFSAPNSSGNNSKSSSSNATDTSSSTFGSKGSSFSVPPTPRTEKEILQSTNLRRFTFSELKGSTRNFRPDSLLGEGGFGSVFKGWMDERTFTPVKPGSGMIVAVKKLKLDSFQGHKEWLAEVNYLGQLSHPNLVKLIGYCLEDEQRLLVYEFMPRGSLEHHLFRRAPHFQPLSWNLRMKVALEAARGLAFLHSDEAKVIYRDFKTSNVLLDSEYNAKLSDFGLAKDCPSGDKSHVSTRVMGTRGYAAPEYLATGHLTAKSDVYTYGVVLLELLTGQRALDKNRPPGQHNLVEWARPYINSKRRVIHVLDQRLGSQYSLPAAQKAAALAMQCLSMDARCRTDMDQVVTVLEKLQHAKKTGK